MWGFSDSGADDGNESQTAANCYDRLSVSAQFATGANVSVYKTTCSLFSNRMTVKVRKSEVMSRRDCGYFLLCNKCKNKQIKVSNNS